MKKLISIILSGLLICTATTTAFAITPKNSTTKITIAHTNDIHGRNSLDDYNKTIGFPKLKTITDKIGADLIVDAGDLFHGQAFATVENGESIAEIINAVGYDAMTPGNHDWNYGQEQLLNLESISGMPIMAGNVIKNNTKKFFDTDYIVKEVDGVKIGLFGVIDPEVYSATNKTLLNGIQYTDMYVYSNAIVSQLKKQGCDVIVALSHTVNHKKFTENVKDVDVLICGHLHQIINETINGTLIVEVGEYLKNIGVINIDYNKAKDEIENITESNISFEDSKAYEEDAKVKKIIDSINASQAVILDEKVGTTKDALDGEKYHVRAYETNLGRVITDAYLHETGADIAIENGGGIRSSIKAGSILKRDIINVSPFGNIIVTKEVIGSDIWAMVEETIELGRRNSLAFTGESEDWPSNDGSYLQIGGVTIKYDSTKAYGNRVESITVGANPIDLYKTYVVAGNNYVMEDNTYSGIAGSKKISEYTTCDDALTKFIIDKGVENSIGNKRFIDVSTEEPTEVTEPTTTPEEPTKNTEPIVTDPTKKPTEEITKAPNTTVVETQKPTESKINTAATAKVATGDSTSVTMTLILLSLSGIFVVLLRRKVIK